MDLRARLVHLLGRDGVLLAADDCARYLTDHRRLYTGRALAVLRPADVAGVSRALAFCNDAGIGVVPQGGNTGYVGGATPDESGTQVVLSLERLDRIRAVDARAGTMVAEAGCILARVQAAAQAVDRLFPLSLGSEGSCVIGGNLATNAGGTAVLRYGMMRDLALGLEVVFPDGRVVSQLSGLRKDNTGYDLRGLFIGSEGTLGVITAACLKLFPPPRRTATALVAIADPAAGLELLRRLREDTDDRLSTCELLPRVAVDLVLSHVPRARDPGLPGAEWLLLVEVTSAAEAPLEEALEASLTRAAEAGLVQDAALARSAAQREDFWRLRESVPEAQRHAGGSLKHDVSLPLEALPGFIDEGAAIVARLVPEGYLIAYGHLGDGNLHFNVGQRAGSDGAAFLAREPELKRAVHDLVAARGGSFSAEHGVGRLKVAELERYAPPGELAAMHAIKRALDPRGIMNPGKVLSPATAAPAR